MVFFVVDGFEVDLYVEVDVVRVIYDFFFVLFLMDGDGFLFG